MQLTERIIIKPADSKFMQIDALSSLTKNLYNAALYDIRQHFFTHKKYKNHYQVIKDFTKDNNPDYRALPAKISQQVIRLAGQNFRSFFGLLKAKRKARIPKYLPKAGRGVVIFPKDAISRNPKEVATGLWEHTLCPRDLNLRFKSHTLCPDMVRVVPKPGYYVLEVVYSVEAATPIEDNGRYASIDLGVNNLAAVYFNTGQRSILYPGGVVKSINQYYNKTKAKLQSKLPKGVKSSKKIKRLTAKRNQKVDWIFHNVSRQLVNHLVSENISVLVIGQTKEWKQDINLGRRNNQNFVNIPFSKLINQLEYKCRLAGITIVLTEESYSSKASSVDCDALPVYGTESDKPVFSGERVKRGLYRTAVGKLVNSDVNGAANIMRKVFPDEKVFSKGIEGVVGHPVRRKCAQTVNLS